MRIKQVVWDWNGTLLDDIDVSMDALNVILKQEQLPLVTDPEEYRRYFQFPVIEYYKKVGFDFEKTSFEQLANKYMAHYQPHSLHCRLHAHVEDILQVLNGKGIQQYVLSASKLTFLKEQLAQYHIMPYLQGIYGLNDIQAHSKKALAIDFIRREHIHQDSTVFIGDSVHDSEVAHAAGCHCVLIANGHEHIDKLKTTGVPVVSMIKDIPSVLETL